MNVKVQWQVTPRTVLKEAAGAPVHPVKLLAHVIELVRKTPAFGKVLLTVGIVLHRLGNVGRGESGHGSQVGQIGGVECERRWFCRKGAKAVFRRVL